MALKPVWFSNKSWTRKISRSFRTSLTVRTKPRKRRRASRGKYTDFIHIYIF